MYVEAVNAHGAGQGSSRIVFRTASRKVEDLVVKEHPYNQTDCCLKSGLKPECKSPFFYLQKYQKSCQVRALVAENEDDQER